MLPLEASEALAIGRSHGPAGKREGAQEVGRQQVEPVSVRSRSFHPAPGRTPVAVILE